MFFSIVIPTFNSGESLDDCLRSILCQTYRNYEILIVDKQSSDDTHDIINNYSDFHHCIFTYTESNLNIYGAMNFAISRSKGQWLYFLGSDDTLYSPFILEEIHTQVKKIECEIIYGNVLNTGSKEIYGSLFELKDFLYKNICQQSIFYNKHVFTKLKSFDVQYVLFSDWEFNIRCWSRKDIPIQYLNKTIANYSSNGLSSKKIDYHFLCKRYDIILFNGIWFLDNTTKKYLMELSLAENRSKTIYIRYPLYRIYIILDSFYFILKNSFKKLFKGKQ